MPASRAGRILSLAGAFMLLALSMWPSSQLL